MGNHASSLSVPVRYAISAIQAASFAILECRSDEWSPSLTSATVAVFWGRPVGRWRLSHLSCAQSVAFWLETMPLEEFSSPVPCWWKKFWYLAVGRIARRNRALAYQQVDLDWVLLSALASHAQLPWSDYQVTFATVKVDFGDGCLSWSNAELWKAWRATTSFRLAGQGIPFTICACLSEAVVCEPIESWRWGCWRWGLTHD